MQSPLSVGNFGGNSAGALENQFKLLFYKGIPHFAQFLSGEQSVRRQKLSEAAGVKMNSKVLSRVNRPAHGPKDGRRWPLQSA
ncbi:hypothetical protein [Acidovorax cavernicola]|uniref:hypothetical protein n=1 Tax=Acidovorax cavernicola TaxID=1675792 RepID=UPI0011C34CFB|nr:hypothetical protein [Acidovorax cavernicola]